MSTTKAKDTLDTLEKLEVRATEAIGEGMLWEIADDADGGDVQAAKFLRELKLRLRHHAEAERQRDMRHKKGLRDRARR